MNSQRRGSSCFLEFESHRMDFSVLRAVWSLLWASICVHHGYVRPGMNSVSHVIRLWLMPLSLGSDRKIERPGKKFQFCVIRVQRVAFALDVIMQGGVITARRLSQRVWFRVVTLACLSQSCLEAHSFQFTRKALGGVCGTCIHQGPPAGGSTA